MPRVLDRLKMARRARPAGWLARAGALATASLALSVVSLAMSGIGRHLSDQAVEAVRNGLYDGAESLLGQAYTLAQLSRALSWFSGVAGIGAVVVSFLWGRPSNASGSGQEASKVLAAFLRSSEQLKQEFVATEAALSRARDEQQRIDTLLSLNALQAEAVRAEFSLAALPGQRSGARWAVAGIAITVVLSVVAIIIGHAWR